MAHLKYLGQPTETIGELPKVGTLAPDFTGVKRDMSDTSLKDYRGKKVILNIFLSLDTVNCANSVRAFNALANKLENTKVLCISLDLPPASHRFCSTENLENVITVSMFRNPEFGKNYGVTILDGIFRGALSRAIVILDETGKVIYTEHVENIEHEPDYDKALAALKK